MKLNSNKKGDFGSGISSKKTNPVFEIFKNDLVNEWIADKKDISELNEQWLTEVSGEGKRKRAGRVIPFIANDEDDFIYVA